MFQAWRHWREGKALELMDPTLANRFAVNEVLRSIHIALLCVQEAIVDRPTMSSIVLMVDSYSLTLACPSPPTFVVGGKELTSNQSTSN